MVDLPESLTNKQQIQRILGIQTDAQQQNAKITLHDTSVNIDSKMTKEQYIELTSCRPRKRNLSAGSEGSNDTQYLFGNKDEIIYVDLNNDDSLAKLALKYACSVAELKNANKIYNDTELHAKRTIKIPVFKNGEIFDTYKKSVIEKEKQEAINTQSAAYIPEDIESKYKFRIQKEYSLKSDLDYMSTDDDEELFNITSNRNSETVHLLNGERTKRTHISQRLDGCDEPFQQFIDRMDQELEKQISEVESKKGNLEEVVKAMTTPVIFAPGLKEKPEELGSVCSFGWKSILFLLCVIAVISPIIYVIYFQISKHKT